MNNSPQTPDLIIHTFVYEGDADIIEETFLCARQALPEARFVMIDDINYPCPSELRGKMVNMGVEWRESSWSRGGNLRGRECILGILDEMLASSQSDDDILIKLDADTCLMNGDDIRRFAGANDRIMCAAGDMDVRIFGMCYCLRSHVVAEVRDYLAEMELPDYAAEDVVIGFSVIRLYPDPSLHSIYKTDERDSTWSAYQWWYYPNAGGYKNCSVITVGNTVPPPLSKTQRRAVMKALRLKAAESLKEVKPLPQL